MSLSAIKGLIIKLGGLREGKKALVLVSEGYSNYIPPQMQSMNGQVRGQGNAAYNDPFAGDGQQQQTLRFFGEAEMMGRLKDIFDLANRYNVSIYALDPRGLAAFEQDIDEGGAGISLTTDKEMLRMTLTSLQVLADNTDGRAIVNKNDLAAGMRQILRDQSAYYLLGYNSSKAPVDGKFHEIKVKVKRPGLDIRARKGYVAFNSEDLKKALAPTKDDRPKDVDLALASIVTPAARGDFIHSWMGMSRGSNGKTKITYVWEPATPWHGTPDGLARPADGDWPRRHPFLQRQQPSTWFRAVQRDGRHLRTVNAGAVGRGGRARRARRHLRSPARPGPDEGTRAGRGRHGTGQRLAPVLRTRPDDAGRALEHAGGLSRENGTGSGEDPERSQRRAGDRAASSAAPSGSSSGPRPMGPAPKCLTSPRAS